MQDELLTLCNIGKTSALWLHACGIHTRSDLARLGSAKAYFQVKSRGFNVSRVLLYSIEGALLDQSWQTLSDETKARLNQEVTALEQK